MNVPIIAADGAANKLLAHNIMPTYIVGDGDSVQQSTNNITITNVIIDDQNSTDFEKCILFARGVNLLPALILGINGGEIDHILGNIQAFLKHADNLNLYFLDTYAIGTAKENIFGIKLGVPLTSKKLTINMKTKSIISIIPVHNVKIQSDGLFWELNNHQFTVNGVLGIRNFNKNNVVTFDILHGKAVLIADVSEIFVDLTNAMSL
jgi:thiamine pyrophosphokinase